MRTVGGDIRGFAGTGPGDPIHNHSHLYEVLITLGFQIGISPLTGWEKTVNPGPEQNMPGRRVRDSMAA